MKYKLFRLHNFSIHLLVCFKTRIIIRDNKADLTYSAFRDIVL